jgi:hypothetical protein
MLIGNTEIDIAVIKGLSLRYPNTNVEEQMALMALWLAKNPSREPKRPIRFIENWLKKASPKLRAVPKIVPCWWQSDGGTLEQARMVGLSARPGEEMGQFRERIRERMKAA